MLTMDSTRLSWCWTRDGGRSASKRVPRSTGQRRATSEATAGAMVDHNGGVPRFVGAASRVDGPHLVGGRGADRAVVGVGLAHAGRSQARMSCSRMMRRTRHIEERTLRSCTSPARFYGGFR